MSEKIKLFLQNMKLQFTKFFKAIKKLNNSLLDCYNTLKHFKEK